MKEKKERLDKILVDLQLVPTRSKAKALIMAGAVFVENEKIEKAGTLVDPSSQISIKGGSRFVSRGGDKLQAAIDAFRFQCTDLTAIDVGASTGGFTDCLLQNGAKHVYAVDVGYGQLAWKLRQDPRVTVLERENIRYLTKDKIPSLSQIAVIDCSFISLRLVLPSTIKFLSKNSHIIALIKPQFEVGRENLGKGGVVRDDKIRSETIAAVKEYAQELGLDVMDGIDSPVHGPAGNIEYLVLLKMTNPPSQEEA